MKPLDHPARPKRRRTTVALIAAVPLALFLGACSSSSSSTNSSSSLDASKPSSSTSSGPKLTGAPVKIGIIGEITGPFLNWPFQAAADKAAALGLNSRGGIKGHPVQIVACDGQNNPNVELQCARTLIGDGVVAVAGGITVFNGVAVDAAFVQAGIAQVGVNPLYPQDFNNSNQFLINNSAVSLQLGGVIAAQKAGLQKVFYIAAASPASTTADNFAQLAGAALGVKVGHSFFPLTDTTSFTAQVQAAISFGADSIMLGNSDAQNSGIILAMQQAGLKVPIINIDTGPSVGVSAACGSGGGICAGAIGAGSTLPPSDGQNAGVKLFQQDMAAEAATGDAAAKPNASYNAFGLVGWLAVEAIAKVADKLPTITAATVLQGFKTAKDIPLWNIIPDWTPNKSVGIPGYSRISSPYIYVNKLNSDLIPILTDPTPYDMTKLVPAILKS
jgi:ABC-type branched-subunit amino acid transport system substrate-binding protein